jgi:hypothetical protein
MIYFSNLFKKWATTPEEIAKMKKLRDRIDELEREIRSSMEAWKKEYTPAAAKGPVMDKVSWALQNILEEKDLLMSNIKKRRIAAVFGR